MGNALKKMFNPHCNRTDDNAKHNFDFLPNKLKADRLLIVSHINSNDLNCSKAFGVILFPSFFVYSFNVRRNLLLMNICALKFELFFS